MKKVFGIFLSVILFSGVGAINHANAENVPPWIKNTAKWYGDGLISEKEFLSAIKYLIENRIINLDGSEIPTITPDSTKQELIEHGIDQLELKNNLAALEFFNKALEKDPNNIRALADKAIVLARQGHYTDAKNLFDKAIELSENNGQVDYRIVANAGIVLSIYGDPAKAYSYFDRVLENETIVRQETLTAVLINKGVTLLEQGHYDESIQYFDRALEIELDRIGALVNKANALQETKRFDEAFVLFKKAHQLTKDPLSWKPQFVIIR